MMTLIDPWDSRFRCGKPMVKPFRNMIYTWWVLRMFLYVYRRVICYSLLWNIDILTMNIRLFMGHGIASIENWRTTRGDGAYYPQKLENSATEDGESNKKSGLNDLIKNPEGSRFKT
jgi:hypothetical protein